MPRDWASDLTESHAEKEGVDMSNGALDDEQEEALGVIEKLCKREQRKYEVVLGSCNCNLEGDSRR